jgi:YwiC-like protein
MSAISRSAAPSPTIRHRWLPRQHGGWAMLALPLLLGIAASRPDPWQLVLGAASVSAYVASTVLQAWSRARRPAAYRGPIVAWASVLVVSGLPLVALFPQLLLGLVVILPAAALVFAGARPGTRRDLVNSLAQVAQALVLVPAAAIVSGSFEGRAVAVATLVAAGYLVGSVLVVRSVLRERDNPAFAALSVGFHAVLLVLALAARPSAYALVAAWLLLRAIALPLAQRRWAGGSHPLRPVHVGIIEIVSSASVVLVSFVAPG